MLDGRDTTSRSNGPRIPIRVHREAMSPIAPVLGEQRTLLSSVSWITHEALADESTGNRLTYDQGDLEIMSPMMPHETAKRLLAQMIDLTTIPGSASTFSPHRGTHHR